MLPGRLIHSTLARMNVSAMVVVPVWTAMRLSQSRSVIAKRPSRRRYAASNTRGRVGQAKDLVELMKAKPKDEAKAFYDGLHPRDKLDIVRLLHEKRKKRRSDRSSSALPKHYSVIFEKNYFFREEDVTEESTLGRGPGGQATNRRMQTAIVRHTPSNIIVKFSRFPSLWLNRRAARELLNLRLEEHLLGPASRLGKARAAREQRQRRRQRTVQYLTKKGDRLQSREADRCRWCAFLEGTAPLPEKALRPMAAMAPPSAALTVALLFGEECNHWWPMLLRAVEAAPDGMNGFSSEASVPLFLRYLFPATYAAASREERVELEKCRRSGAALVSTARAFVCFCELFGLRLREAAPSATGEVAVRRCVLQRDGLNWVQYHSRLQQDGQLTRVGRVCWPHVYLSLRQLDMQAEARAIVVFLKREAKGEKGGSPQAWPQEMLKCLSVAVRESTSADPLEANSSADASAIGDTVPLPETPKAAE